MRLNFHITGCDLSLLARNGLTDGFTPEQMLPSLGKKQLNSTIIADEKKKQMSPLEDILVEAASLEKLLPISSSSELPEVKGEYQGEPISFFFTSLSSGVTADNYCPSFHSLINVGKVVPHLSLFILEEQICLPAGAESVPEKGVDEEQWEMEQISPAIMITVEEEQKEVTDAVVVEEEEEDDDIRVAVEMIVEDDDDEDTGTAEEYNYTVKYINDAQKQDISYFFQLPSCLLLLILL